VTSFVHEQKRKLSEADYIGVAGLLERRRRPLRLAIIFAVAIACLFWKYTIAFGVLLLVLALITLFIPRLLPAGAATTYHDSPHLQQELTYTVTDRDLSVIGPDLQCHCSWKNLKVWRERDGWLILSPNAMPPLFLRVDSAKAAGVYYSILALARENAREFNK
jgi:hypothetical protein